MAEKVERFEASNGASIYRLAVEPFPGFTGYVFVVAGGDKLTLVDTGSGLFNSHRDLLTGFEEMRVAYGVSYRLEDVERIIVTHGHIDHFGGVWQVKRVAEKAEVVVHVLARLVLIRHDESVLVTSRAMKDFLKRAGVPGERAERLFGMYMIGKRSFPPMRVNVGVEDGDELGGVMRVMHVPGHAPGLIMVQIGDVLLTSDHILPNTSVVLAPESIMPYTGVGHYLESLRKAEQVEGVRLALGGHERPMFDYYEVARRTREQVLEKIERVLEVCEEPHTIYEIARQIYGEMDGYGELLKLWQTGARIEYLNQRGQVVIENMESLEKEDNPALCYVRA